MPRTITRDHCSGCPVFGRIPATRPRSGRAPDKIDWAFQPSLNRAFIANLATLAFIDNREDLLITGKSGTGKSHILQALTLRACERKIRVRYTRCVDVINDLYAGLADRPTTPGSEKSTRAEWLVIDDDGLGQLRHRDDNPPPRTCSFYAYDRICDALELTRTSISSCARAHR